MADGAGGANGAAAALRLLQAVGAAAGGASDGGAAQVELFEGFEAIDAPLPLEPAKGRSGPQGGRPAGARNKSTDEWVRYFLSRHQSPMTALGQIYSRPLEDLVDELQRLADKSPAVQVSADGLVTRTALRINPLEVLRLQLQAMQAIMPYVHKAQPKAIEIEQRQLGVVLLGDLPAGAGDALTGHGGGNDDLALPELQSVDYQEVTTAQPAQSDAPQSDKPANPLIFRDDAS